jgi:DegV family protein with EDD domain
MRRTPAGMEIDEMKRIVVDSSASLYQMDGIDFAAVPLKIVTDEREYLDDGTLDAVEMATTLRTYKGKTSTSCPNIGDWLEAYEGADEIYAITITGTLSGSCNAAQLAAEEYQAEHPGAQVFVLDSLSAGPELVLLAEHIRALIQEGREFDDVCEEMLRYRHHTHLLFSLESLALPASTESPPTNGFFGSALPVSAVLLGFSLFRGVWSTPCGLNSSAIAAPFPKFLSRLFGGYSGTCPLPLLVCYLSSKGSQSGGFLNVD